MGNSKVPYTCKQTNTFQQFLLELYKSDAGKEYIGGTVSTPSAPDGWPTYQPKPGQSVVDYYYQSCTAANSAGCVTLSFTIKKLGGNAQSRTLFHARVPQKIYDQMVKESPQEATVYSCQELGLHYLDKTSQFNTVVSHPCNELEEMDNPTFSATEWIREEITSRCTGQHERGADKGSESVDSVRKDPKKKSESELEDMGRSMDRGDFHTKTPK